MEEVHKVFTAKVREIMAAQNCSIEAAADKVRVLHPALFRSYVNELLSLSGLEYNK